jgi:predicted HNH restriction endonuclease
MQCHKKRKIRRWEKKKKLLELAGSKCQICGFDRFVTALEFHHKDPSQKLFDLNTARDWDFKKIQKVLEEEIQKCILVCANCHRGIHEAEQKEKL